MTVWRVVRWLLLVTLLYLYLSRFQQALIDDAYITLQYARNLRDYGAWGFYPDYLANTVTSPLNVWLLAATGFVVRDLPTTAIVLATAESLLLFLLLRQIGARIGSQFFGIGAYVALLGNPLLVSTLGLESLLFATLLTASACCWLIGRPVALACCLALLTLTRPDGVLLFVVLLAFSRRRLLTCGAYLVALLPWYAYSWSYLGGLAPDTLLIKVDQHAWGAWSFGGGPLLYLVRYPLQTIATLIFLPLSLRLPWTPHGPARQLAEPLAVYAVLYFGAYTLLGVPPYHWYYAPLVTAVTLIALLNLAAVRPAQARRLRVVVPALPALGLLLYFAQAGITPKEAPIHTNWAPAARYQEIGTWLRANLPEDSHIKLNGEIGTVSFYSERHIFDRFSCRQAQMPMMNRQIETSSLMALALAINHAWWQPGPECEPYSHHLIMVPRPTYEPPDDGEVVMEWTIQSRWVPEGHVLLVQLDPQAASSP